jgi:hypothetical protein
MRARPARPGIVLAALALATPASGAALAQQGEVIDGIAATVNAEVITIGEVQRAALMAREDRQPIGRLCPGAPLAGESPSAPDAAAAEAVRSGPLQREELEAARECLIDTRLVFREVRRFPRIGFTQERLDAMLAALQADYASTAEFEADLRRLALTEAEVRAGLRRQMLINDYIDNRFRATVEITDEQARTAWDEEFVPDMGSRAIEIPPFAEVKDDFIVPILREREVNRRVQSWILDLRDRSTIRRMYP